MIRGNNLMVLLACLVLFTGCEEEPVNQELLQQNPINVEGEWVLDKVYQNQVDITDILDINNFTLSLNYSGDQPTSYSINTDKRYPFLYLENNGSWTFDNTTFPTAIHFVSNDTITSVLNSPLYPDNNTTLILEINLGCSDNEYIYEFRKELLP